MAYGFDKLITENNLKVTDLPEEVQNAIDYLKDTEKGINMIKKRSQKAGKEYVQSEATSKKIKQLDAWAIRGITEYLEGEIIKGAAPVTDEDILKQANKDNPVAAVPPIVTVPPVVTTASTAAVITDEPKKEATPHELDIELLALHKAKIEILTLEEVKEKAPKAYEIIFKAYKEGEENGLATSNFSLLETENNNFKLSKK